LVNGQRGDDLLGKDLLNNGLLNNKLFLLSNNDYLSVWQKILVGVNENGIMEMCLY
jgi:hypothetical protein